MTQDSGSEEETEFGQITITNVLRSEDNAHHVRVTFGELSIIEVLGMLEMARMQAYQHALGLMEDDE